MSDNDLRIRLKADLDLVKINTSKITKQLQDSATLAFESASGALQQAKNAFNTVTQSGSPGGGITSLLGDGFKGITEAIQHFIPLLGIAGIGTLLIKILESSKSLMRTVGMLNKLVEVLLRPIGDVISMVLRPVLMLLRPFVMMLNALIRPYLQDARKMIALSFQTRAAGDVSGANEIMLNAGLVLASGFIAVLVTGIGEGLKVMVDLLVGQINSVIDVFGALGGEILKVIGASDETLDSWNNMIDAIKNHNKVLGETTKEMIDNTITTVQTALHDFRNVLVNRSVEIAEAAGVSSEAFDDLEKSVGVVDDVSGYIDDITKSSGNVVKAIGGFLLSFGTVEDILSKGLTNAKTDAEEFSKVLQKMFPEVFVPVETNKGGFDLGGLVSSFLLATAGPLDEMFEMLFGLVEGDINKVGKGFFDLINPIRDAQQWFYFLQEATKALHGEGGHGFVELQQEVSKSIMEFAENTFQIKSFSSAITNVINSMYSALRSAQSAAESAARSASSAAASASRAASAASSAASSGGTAGKSKAIGGFVGRDDWYYLHSGEMVVPKGEVINNSNPVSININIDKIETMDANDLKRKLDDLISDSMRKHYRTW